MARSVYTGWLFDLYEDSLDGMVLWLIGDDGQRHRLRHRFPATFFAAGDARSLHALATFLAAMPDPARTWYTERSDAFSRRKEMVLAIQAASPTRLTQLFRQVARQFPNLQYADADLAPSLRYAAVTGVSPLCRCRMEVDAQDVVHSVIPMEDPWQLDPSDLPLRVLTLEPECSPSHRTPQFITARYRPTGWRRFQTARSDGQIVCRLPLEPARALLVTLQSILASYDPDLILTSWGDTWLLSYLLAKAEEHNITLSLNRDPYTTIARQQERWYFSYGRLIYRGEQVSLFGRWHIDRSNAMMWSDYGLEGVLESARVTALPVQTAARVSPGTGISAIQILAALRSEILVPWQKPQAEMLKPAADLYNADQGGLVYQPVVGVHRNVVAMDFVSMYPAIIVRFNISPETINANGPNTMQVPAINLTIQQAAPGERKGIVALALAPLLEKRVALKRRLAQIPVWDPRHRRDKIRSTALKWLLVTCFGYLGYKNARFGRIEAHQAVTAYGREALLKAKEAAEAAGAEVLHAYVDSIYIQWPHKPDPSVLERLQAEIEAETGLPIAVDGIFRWLVFLSSRTNQRRAVANRYFGVFQNGEVKVRGIAARRRDTPPFVARVQMELVGLLGREDEPEEALPAVLMHLRQRKFELNNGRVPLRKLLLTQRISREVEDYRVPSPAARAAKQLLNAGKKVKPGQHVQFLYTRGAPGVCAWGLRERLRPEAVDLPRYLELLERAAREVLEPFGV